MLIVEIAAGILLACLVLWVISTLISGHRERWEKQISDDMQRAANDPQVMSHLLWTVEERSRAEEARHREAHARRSTQE